jgi:hypothetical protein
MDWVTFDWYRTARVRGPIYDSRSNVARRAIQGLLSYYNPEDVLLFAGRDNDIDECVDLVAQSSTRTLILQGRTACGKSSFLRAGLIPAIESIGYGFIFLRRDKDEHPVLIRCTGDPIARLAEELFRFTSRSWRISTALGAKDIELPQIRRGHDKITEFVDACRDPYTLLGILQDIAKEFSHTLVIVLDQAEEVITLARPSEQGPKNFFDFLKLFNASNLNVKLVVSLRTERFGEFFRFLQFDASAITDVKQYLLENLDRPEVRCAIELPTLKRVAGVKKAPFEVYGFEYDPGLIDKIVDDLFATDPSGGILPVMQVVCRDLYNEVRRLPTPRRITARLYELGGGVSGRVDKHIGQSLQAAFKDCEWTQDSWENEERRWRTGLSKLANANPDGTVSTDVRTEDSLKTMLKEAGVTAPITSVLDYLSQTEVLVVRRFSASSPVDGSPCLLYSLGHDAIALALHRWTLRDQEAVEVRRRFKIAASLAGLLFLICLGAIGYIVESNRSIVLYAEAVRASAEREFRNQPGIATTAIIHSINKLKSRVFVASKGTDPQLTLANIVSTLPGHIIDANDLAASRSFALPTSKKLIFWNRISGLTIVSWDGSRRKSISVADLIRGRTISGQVTLANAEELSNNGFLIRLQDEASSTIALIENDEDVRIYDTEYFINLSRNFKVRLAKLKESAESNPTQSRSLRARLAIVKKMVFLYLTNKGDAYVETFALNDNAQEQQNKFHSIGWVEQTGVVDSEFVWMYMLNESILIISTLGPIPVGSSQNPLGLRQRSRSRVRLEVSAFDMSTYASRRLWSFASIDSVKECLNRKEENSQQCVIEVDDRGRDSPVMVVYVPPNSSQTKRNEARELGKLVFLDVRAGSSNEIDASVLIQGSEDAMLGPRWTSRRDDYFDNLMVGGPAASPTLVVRDGRVYDVFKLKDKKPIYIGTYSPSEEDGQLFFSEDKNVLVEMSSFGARMWNISEPAGGQIKELAQLEDRELVTRVCNASLPEYTTREEWQDLTNFTDDPPQYPCN